MLHEIAQEDIKDFVSTAKAVKTVDNQRDETISLHVNNSTSDTRCQPVNPDKGFGKSAIALDSSLNSLNQFKKPEYITDKHFQEFRDSCIPDEVTALNIKSLAGTEVLDYLNLKNDIPYVQKTYSYLLNGGWACNGIVKPDTPLSPKRKYENARGREPKPYLTKLPETIWQEIAKKHQVEKPLNLDGWTWVRENNIPIAVAEGIKKALCVAVNGLIPTVAILGHTNAYKTESDVVFSAFLQPDRTIKLIFDNDVMSSTRNAVSTTINRVIEKVGKRAKVEIVKWYDNSKGIDDYCVKHGIDSLNHVLDNALTPNQWVDDSHSALGFVPDILFNSKHFQEVLLSPDKPLIVLKGGKGSGKTYCMERMVLQAKAENRPLALFTPRRILTQATGVRLGIPYVDELDEKIVESNQVALVINSLWKLNPQNFKGGVIFIDEINLVLDDLMLASTTKSKRRQIIETLGAICQVIKETGGNLVVADADVNEASIRFLLGRFDTDVKPYIVENEYRETSYTCYSSEGYSDKCDEDGNPINHSADDVLATVVNAGLQGKRIFIGCTAQQVKSRFGTTNIEAVLDYYGLTDRIRIDSTTTNNPEHDAFKAAKRINEICDRYQIVLASPSINVGVSIENAKPFDLVVGIATGKGSADAVRQMLMRVRDKSVPRLLWVAKRGYNDDYIKFGTTSKQVENNTNELYTITREQLTKIDSAWNEEYPDLKCIDTVATYFDKSVAAQNAENYTYKKSVHAGLRREGVNLIEIGEACDIFPYTEVTPDQIKKLTEEIKDKGIKTLHKKKASAEILNDDNYSKLKQQTQFTESERITLEANIIARRYPGVDVTEQLQQKDDKEWYSKIRLHYICTVGQEVSNTLNALYANRQVNAGSGVVVKHDFLKQSLAKSAFINDSGILNLIGKDVSQTDNESLTVFDYLLKNLKDLKLLFGESIGKNEIKNSGFNFKLFKVIFDALGIECETQRKKIKGKYSRAYKIVEPDDDRKTVFTNWLIKNTEEAKKWEEIKRENSIIRLAKNFNPDTDNIIDFILNSSDFNQDVWERINTDARIKAINKLEQYTVPNPTVIKLDPDSVDFENHLELIKTWDAVSLDIETYGLDTKNKEGLHARKGKIRLIQISNGETVYIADLGDREQAKQTAVTEAGFLNQFKKFQPFLDILKEKVSNPDVKIIGHNIHFDLRFLTLQLGFTRARNVVDTMKGLQIFFGDYGGLQVLPGGYGLGNACAKLLGTKVDKTEQKSDWGLPLTDSQLTYASYDPFITYHLYNRIEDLYSNPTKYGFRKLAQDGIREAWQLENDVIPCAVELEVNGLPINRVEAQTSLERCQAIQSELLEQWKNQVPGLSYTQNSKLKDHLNQTYNLTIKSLNKSALADLNHLPEVQLLGKLRAIKVPIQQLESLLKSSADTGRIQTNFKTLTGTGRFSSGDSRNFKDLPNLQSISAKGNPALKEFENLPKVRDCVTPTESATQFYIIDHKTASKKLKTYQHILTLTKNEQEISYINRAITHLALIISCPDDIVLVDNTLKYSWEDDKDFVKKHKDFDPAIKTCARLVQDRVIAIVDLAASHGRIAADVANDDVAILGCNDDTIDNHSKVAEYIARALGHDITWKEIQDNKKEQPYRGYRDAAKNTYYGWLNGAGAKRVQEQIKANSGQVVSIEACQAAIKGCEELYPNIVNFRKNLVDELSTKSNLQFIDGKYYAINKIHSVENRIVHLVKVSDTVDLPYTQCLAAIWSRTEASALKRALIQILDLSDKHPEWNLKVINYVHDEINVEFDTVYAKSVATKINDIIGDCFAATLTRVNDGREQNWKKLLVNNWSEK